MTPALVAELNSQFKFKLIDLDLIDDPRKPERETMDDVALAELSQSIATVGLIKPLIVLPRGNRYEVDAGHRRLIGCRIAQYSPVPCRVKINETISSRAIMVHENAHTEPVNAIEEARFYQEYMVEECGNDVDILCAQLRRGRDYVEGRLNLLIGWPTVINALAESRISIGVATQLNRVVDPNQLLILLDAAIQQGASIREVTKWVREANASELIQLPADEVVDPDAPPAPPVHVHTPTCLFCDSSKHAHTLQLVYLHPPCKDMVLAALGREDPAAP